MSLNCVVIGGSIAGMLAARVLADYCAVTIVETDNLPTQPHARKGVPQSVQPHVLITKGYRVIEELFPGIGKELQAAGALPIDWAQEFYHFMRGEWNAIAPSPSDIISFTCTRPLLEWCIRQRLANFSNVQFLEQHRVTGLRSNNNHINGVSLHSLADAHQTILSADLVVDASGRRSLAPKWLPNLGLTPPTETVINPFLGYATRRYKLPNFNFDWKVMLISHSPPHHPRLGYLAKIEGDELIATLSGYGHNYPPLDEQGFLDFARSLPSPNFYQAIRKAEPVSPIYAHRATANRLYHYDQISMPKGFIALGDAVCALCPVYGQGITVSALSAIVLQKWLKVQTANFDHGNSNTTSFQKKLAKSNAPHWALATNQDLKFSQLKEELNLKI